MLLGVTAALVVAGCSSSKGGSEGGNGDEPTVKPSASPSASGSRGPDCASIWKAGATLPKDYTQCIKDGAVARQDVTKYKDGTTLVAYADTYYAITGGTIRKPEVAPMHDTEEFGKAFSDCTGEQPTRRGRAA